MFERGVQAPKMAAVQTPQSLVVLFPPKTVTGQMEASLRDWPLQIYSNC